ncbi:uncharacterized protein LOC116003954 [Ipomoea triloba]|uniref:uncharacterized protein LOC116003954 n=1 Tax=Ipomoea triloba TaxID=35885 RepID=UPI00125E45AC|nr:uncharacterized protein LOC116003954 [Ipomoea triloba]
MHGQTNPTHILCRLTDRTLLASHYNHRLSLPLRLGVSASPPSASALHHNRPSPTHCLGTLIVTIDLAASPVPVPDLRPKRLPLSGIIVFEFEDLLSSYLLLSLIMTLHSSVAVWMKLLLVLLRVYIALQYDKQITPPAGTK